MDELNDIDDLLQQHNRRRNGRDDPRQTAINLIRPRHFQRSRTPGASKETGRRRMGGITGLHGARLGLGGLEERRREGGRGEREEVDADEEEFVQGAADEQDRLHPSSALPPCPRGGTAQTLLW